jgi:hypothetical protein
MFGARLPRTKFMVIKIASSRVGTIAPHKIYPGFIFLIFPLKMYKQTATILKHINFEIVYTPDENKCIYTSI